MRAHQEQCSWLHLISHIWEELWRRQWWRRLANNEYNRTIKTASTDNKHKQCTQFHILKIKWSGEVSNPVVCSFLLATEQKLFSIGLCERDIAGQVHTNMILPHKGLKMWPKAHTYDKLYQTYNIVRKRNSVASPICKIWVKCSCF